MSPPTDPAELPRLSTDAQTIGREIVRTLQVALRTARTHAADNAASIESIEAFRQAIGKAAVEQDGMALHVLGDFLYLDNVRLRVDATGHRSMDHLVRELSARGIGSIFVQGEVRAEDVRAFMSLLNDQPIGDEESVARMNEDLANQGSPFSLEPIHRVEDLALAESIRIDRREQCKIAFFKAFTVTKAFMNSVHLEERIDLHHAKRVVQQMVDLIVDEEFTLLGLTTLKAADSYTFYHSVNVCIYALALGKRAGMTRGQLCELGLGALMHDLGKAKVPIEVLRKKGSLTPEEWQVVRQHPQLGVKELIRMRGLSAIAYKSMIGCFEHHLSYDGGSAGYPPLRYPYKLHVAGRIVAIVDTFDAMTTKRVYMDRAHRRDRALSYIVSEAGRRFDPVLVRLFANLIGVFPVGTAVRLRSGRLAVVVAVSPDPNLCHRPVVRPITDESGFVKGYTEYPAIDLARRGADGSYADEIVSALDPESIGLEVARYFI